MSARVACRNLEFWIGEHGELRMAQPGTEPKPLDFVLPSGGGEIFTHLECQQDALLLRTNREETWRFTWWPDDYANTARLDLVARP